MGRDPHATAEPGPGDPSADLADEVDNDAGPRSGSPWVTIALALALVVMLAVVGVRLLVSWNAAQEQSQRFCAGVGLMGPLARTPEAAFAAWLAEDRPADQAAAANQPSGWRGLPRSANAGQDGSADDVVYQDRHDAHRSVSISRTGTQWQATGACV